MSSRFAFVLVTHLAIAAPVCAMETFDCASADGQIAVEYDYQYDAPNPFTRVQMQIEGDFGISTDPAHPDNSGEFIGSSFEGANFKGVDVDWKDENGRVHSGMKLRLVEVSEGPHLLQTGGVSVDGGGVWSITCQARSGDVVAW